MIKLINSPLHREPETNITMLSIILKHSYELLFVKRRNLRSNSALTQLYKTETICYCLHLTILCLEWEINQQKSVVAPTVLGNVLVRGRSWGSIPRPSPKFFSKCNLTICMIVKDIFKRSTNPSIKCFAGHGLGSEWLIIGVDKSVKTVSFIEDFYYPFSPHNQTVILIFGT